LMLSKLVPPEHLAARRRNSARSSGMLHLQDCEQKCCLVSQACASRHMTPEDDFRFPDKDHAPNKG
jgi:hypothetical protein